MKNVSNRIGRYIGQEQNLSEGQIQVISYGVETLIITLIGYLAIFMVAFLVGSLKSSIIFCLITYFLRSFSGGGHCSSWQRCSISGALLVPWVALISQKIIISPLTNSMLWWSGFIIILILIYLYAPKDSASKPIVTVIHRKRLKVLSLGFVLVACLVSFIISPWLGSVIYFAIVWQIFSITPWGVTVINTIDKGLKIFRI